MGRRVVRRGRCGLVLLAMGLVAGHRPLVRGATAARDNPYAYLYILPSMLGMVVLGPRPGLAFPLTLRSQPTSLGSELVPALTTPVFASYESSFALGTCSALSS